MWAGFGVIIVAGMLYAAKKCNDYAVSKTEQDKDSTESNPTIKVRRGTDSETAQAVQSLNREFKCGIGCEGGCQILPPDYNTEYTINGKKYVGYQTLQAIKVSTGENKYGCDCDRISVYRDRYGHKVILLIRDIPCFDSGDREYDSAHLLYLFHNDGQMNALYCREGYRVATLTLFENVTVSHMELRKFLKAEGFPV